MRLKKDSSEQKLRGAYYTPIQLANSIVSFFASEKFNRVLEPSCGDGVFLDAFSNCNMLENLEKIIAVEIEKDEIEKIQTRSKNISLLNEDFFDFFERRDRNEKYDLIIGNPPYIRYQYLTEHQRYVQSKILKSNGMKSNKLINAWVCFLVACVQMLEKNGKIAFIIPAEILQVAYAEDLRLFLSDQLAKITLVTFKKLVFPDISQEVIVFIGEKGTNEKGIRILELDDLTAFENLKPPFPEFQKLLHVKEKWTKYFVSQDEIDSIQNIKNDPRFIKFSDCGLINIGITTGNNNYFSIERAIETEFDLQSVTLPLIGKSSHTHGLYFTLADWKFNIEKGKKAMLINFPNTPFEDYPDKHKKYIKYGENSKQHIGYKCSIRDNWYIVPSVWIPDAFFLRRNNLYPKFVLNSCNAVSTDTMHRMKFHDGIDPETILLSYYNSISFAFTEICGRSYGGGVLEILPTEMGNIMLPKIKKMDTKLKKTLLQKIDILIRENANIELVLDLVDKAVLIDILGIETSLCVNFRCIWKKLQTRRLLRN